MLIENCDGIVAIAGFKIFTVLGTYQKQKGIILKSYKREKIALIGNSSFPK